MNENVHRQRCTPIVVACFGKDYPGVARESGKTRQPGPPVERLLEGIQIGSVSQEMEHYTGVNSSRTRAHRNPIQRSETHGGIDTTSSPDCRQRTTAAQVTEDLAHALIAVPVDDLQRFSACVPITGPMKTVTH